MTTLDSQPYDARQHDANQRVVDETDAHLLRLCLDLQLDALLLTLGAASAQQLRDQGTPADEGPTDEVVPWRRWVDEDVELAATLAADTMAGRATLPPTLGTELGHEVPATVIDNLAARYESMCDLLGDLLRRAVTSGDRPHLRVRTALLQCRARLDELHTYRLGATPPRGVRLDVPPTSGGSPAARDHEYLPGELLG